MAPIPPNVRTAPAKPWRSSLTAEELDATRRGIRGRMGARAGDGRAGGGGQEIPDDGGHLDGVLAVAKVGETIRKFLTE